MLAWSFSEEGAVEKYMPQLQHNVWVINVKTAVMSCGDPDQRRHSIRADSSAMFLGEDVGVEIGNPQLPFLGNAQIAQRVADIGLDCIPEESRIGGAQVLGSSKSELLARAGLAQLGK